MDFSRCSSCDNPASVTAGRGAPDQEPMCLSCAIGLAALMQCAGDWKNDSHALEAAKNQVEQLVTDFPWEPIQSMFDYRVEQLKATPEFRAEFGAPEEKE